MKSVRDHLASRPVSASSSAVEAGRGFFHWEINASLWPRLVLGSVLNSGTKIESSAGQVLITNPSSLPSLCLLLLSQLLSSRGSRDITSERHDYPVRPPFATDMVLFLKDDGPRGRSSLSNSDIIWLRFIRPKTFFVNLIRSSCSLIYPAALQFNLAIVRVRLVTQILT